MDIKTLKSEIYRKIDELDEEQLFQVNEMVTAYLKQTGEEEQWDALSDEDKAAIEEGLEQVEKGMTVPYEVVMDRLNKKFGF
jgi:predicted transcriptional regulator